MTFGGLLQKFKKQHGLRRLDMVEESRSADENVATEYKDNFRALIVQRELTRCQVYMSMKPNCDHVVCQRRF